MEIAAVVMAGGQSARMRASGRGHKALVEILGLTLLERNLLGLLSLLRWMLRKNIRMPVIPNGAIRPLPQKTASEVRSILGLPLQPDGPIICQISSLVEYKGQTILP